jgi:hypothetical protein
MTNPTKTDSLPERDRLEYMNIMAGMPSGLDAPEWLLEDVAVLVGRGIDSSVSPEACKEAVALLVWAFRTGSLETSRA